MIVFCIASGLIIALRKVLSPFGPGAIISDNSPRKTRTCKMTSLHEKDGQPLWHCGAYAEVSCKLHRLIRNIHYISRTKKPVFRKQHRIVRNFEFKLSYMTSSFKLCKQKQVGVSSKTDKLWISWKTYLKNVS